MFRYEVISKVGEGTFGEVFQARNRQTGQVALKKVKIRHLSAGLPKNVLRELQGLESAASPHTLRLFEYFAHGNSVVLVLDFMATDMYEVFSVLLSHGLSLPPAAIQAMARSTARALRVAHHAGVLHRDVKPSNMLLSHTGVMKLGDFGLARVAKAPEAVFSHEVATRWYKAPELLLGAKRYDGKVDSWALGCVIAEAAAGRPMFAGGSDIDQLFKIFHVCGSPLVHAQEDGALTSNCSLALSVGDELPVTPLARCAQVLLSRDVRVAVDPHAHAHRRRLWDGARLLPDFGKLILPGFPGKDFAQLFPSSPPALVDLLQRLLVLDPEQRLDPAQALAHPFLNKNFYTQRTRGSEPHDEWAWWSREVEDEGEKQGESLPEPHNAPAPPGNEVAETEEKQDSDACIPAGPAVLLVGVDVGAGEDEEDKNMLQALVQMVLTARGDEDDDEWYGGGNMGPRDRRAPAGGGAVAEEAEEPHSGSLAHTGQAAASGAPHMTEAGGWTGGTHTGTLDEVLDMDMGLSRDNDADTGASNAYLPRLPPPLALLAVEGDEAEAAVAAASPSSSALDGLESLSSEGVLNLQSYRARAMQLTSPLGAQSLRQGTKRDLLDTLLPTRDTPLGKRIATNRHDLTGDEDAFLAACYAESEEGDFDATGTMDLFGVRRMGWDAREPQDAVHYEDDEETTVEDVESMFPDDVATPGPDYDFVLGEGYEFFQPWMSFESVDYVDIDHKTPRTNRINTS